MRYPESIPPSLEIDRSQARRFMLAHHFLFPPQSLRGKSGILEYISRVGCIQFDPINVVGRNPDLVLQSRIEGYRSELLDELLYGDRLLIDGWDKVASIYAVGDWPYFSRHRAKMKHQHGDPDSPAMQIADQVTWEISERGPLASIDFSHDERIEWSWGQNSRLVRASLEVLYAQGVLGIHHRVNTRRYFDLIERLLPESTLKAADPNHNEQAYQDWHVDRRVGGLGLADPAAGDCWLGILGVKSPQRKAALLRLHERGKLTAVTVQGLPGKTFYLRTADLARLDEIETNPEPVSSAAFIAPLDNLIWNRSTVKLLFDFEYTWEVYKPADKRDYGYYVLPVLYGERFVARFEPVFDKRNRALTVKKWWWEPGIRVDKPMQEAISQAMERFCRYLQVEQFSLSSDINADPACAWLVNGF